MECAPIVIPTLNRMEHLKRCITSLQANSWAERTPLIISVDYPPAEKYVDGYQKICEYLKEGITGFLHVEVIYHAINLGAYGNLEFLRKYIREKYDRYIFTEDDNEFSPNFIEYMNKGLEIFKDDQDIVAICSSGVEEKKTEKYNVVLSQNFAAYGYGTWTDKEDVYYKKIDRAYIKNIARNTKTMLRLASAQPRFIFALQSAIFKKEKLYQLPNDIVPIIDQTIIMYMISEQKYVLAPCDNKVRNWGYDGSGENCHKDNTYDATKIIIDQKKMFDYRYDYPLKISRLRGGYSVENICRIALVFIKIWFWRLTNQKKEK